MALKIIDFGSPEYQQMVKLRDTVLRKPLGLTFTQEDLESEKDNILIAAFEELDELTAGADELDELLTVGGLTGFVVIGSILNQFTLNPPSNALIPKECFPAGKVTVRSTLTHFCQPPVTGTGTVSKMVVPPAS